VAEDTLNPEGTSQKLASVSLIFLLYLLLLSIAGDLDLFLGVDWPLPGLKLFESFNVAELLKTKSF